MLILLVCLWAYFNSLGITTYLLWQGQNEMTGDYVIIRSFSYFEWLYIFYTAISSNHIPQNGWNPTISKNSPIAMKRNTDCPLHVLWTFLAGSGEVCMPGAVIWTMPTYVRKTTPGDEVSDLVEQTAIKSHNETWNTNCGRGTMRFYLILHAFRWIFIWSTAVDLTRCIE